MDRTLIFLLLVLQVSSQVSFEGGFYIQEGGIYLSDEEAYIPPPKYFTPEEVEATLSSIPLLGNVNATQELDNVIVLPPPQPINQEGSVIINVDNPICQTLNCQLCVQAGCTGSTTPPPTTTPPPPTTPPPSPTPPPADGTSTIIPPEKIGSCATYAQKALNAHNAARARYGAAPLLWSRTLANYSQSVSDTCVFRHSNGPYGENLAIGTTTTFSCLRATQLWIEEESRWTYGSRFSSATGHFTQVVWKNSRQVGCAVRNCSGRRLITCSYYPGGNVIGQFNSNVGPRRPSSSG